MSGLRIAVAFYSLAMNARQDGDCPERCVREPTGHVCHAFPEHQIIRYVIVPCQTERYGPLVAAKAVRMTSVTLPSLSGGSIAYSAVPTDRTIAVVQQL
jgi:hypothetical protein